MIFQFVYDDYDYDDLCLSQEHAFESSQKYKEGKYIIELAHMIKENGWDNNNKNNNKRK